MPVDRLDIARLGRSPEGRVAAALGVEDAAENPDADDDRAQENGEDDQRQQNALGPVPDQAAQAALPPYHGREKAADQKEELQPEAVNGVHRKQVAFVLVDILRRPDRQRERHERHEAVQPDPQQHGKRPQGVQIVVSFLG